MVWPSQVRDKRGIIRHIDHTETVIRFHNDAVNSIYSFSGGIPRLINLVCDKALLAAYAAEARDITLSIVERSIQEIEGVVIK